MFDVTSELAIIRARRKMMRRQRYRSSRLDEYRAELLQLREAGATLADIALWLRQRRIRVAISTISRWLRLCREVPDA
jgi:hypothetical protein